MSSGIAPANPAPRVERIGSDATGTESAAESFTQFLEDEERGGAGNPPSPKARRQEARQRQRQTEQDGAGDGDEGQAPDTRQPRGERAEGQDDEADPLRDPVLDDHEAPEGNEDDEGEGDDEGEDENDEDGDEGQDDDEGDDPEHEVTVNGVVQKVKLSELLSGYSREADYRQKTAALAADVEEFEAFTTEVAEQSKAHEAGIKLYRDLIAAVMPSQEEWDLLEKKDPAGFIAAQKQWGGFMEKVEAAKAAEDKIREDNQKIAQRNYDKFVEAENKKLHEKLPQLRNAKVAKQFSDTIFGFAKKMGFSREEIVGDLVEHRKVMTAYYAARYLEIMESRKANQGKGKSKAPRVSESNSNPRSVQSPKGRRAAANGREQRRADRELGRTGSMQSAAASFSAMFRE